MFSQITNIPKTKTAANGALASKGNVSFSTGLKSLKVMLCSTNALQLARASRKKASVNAAPLAATVPAPVVALADLFRGPGDCHHGATPPASLAFLRLRLSLQPLIPFLPPRSRVLPFLRSLPSLPLYAGQNSHARKTPGTNPLQAGHSRRLELG